MGGPYSAACWTWIVLSASHRICGASWRSKGRTGVLEWHLDLELATGLTDRQRVLGQIVAPSKEVVGVDKPPPNNLEAATPLICVKAIRQTGTSHLGQIGMSFSGPCGVPSSETWPGEWLGMCPDSCRTGVRGHSDSVWGPSRFSPTRPRSHSPELLCAKNPVERVSEPGTGQGTPEFRALWHPSRRRQARPERDPTAPVPLGGLPHAQADDPRHPSETTAGAPAPAAPRPRSRCRSTRRSWLQSSTRVRRTRGGAGP